MTAIGAILALGAVVLGADPTSSSTPAQELAPPSSGAPPPTATASSGARDAAVFGAWGVGLLAAGAGLATTSVVSLTLLESLTTPDRQNQPVSAAQETLRSVGGFASATAAGVSVVAMVVGGGLALSAGLDAQGAPSTSPTE